MHGYSFVEIIIIGLLLFSGAWGSAFLAVHLKRFARKLEPGPPSPLIDELRGDAHQLDARLGRVEEELRFFRQLHEPEGVRQLVSPDTPST